MRYRPTRQQVEDKREGDGPLLAESPTLGSVLKKRLNSPHLPANPDVSIWQQIGSWPPPLCFRIPVPTTEWTVAGSSGGLALGIFAFKQGLAMSWLFAIA